MSGEKKEIKFASKNLTAEQIQKLKNQGFDIKIKEEWICTCPFCKKEFKRDTGKQASRSLSVHIGKCKNYKFTIALKNMMPNPEEFKMGDVVYVLTGEISEHYKLHPDNEKTLKEIRQIYQDIEDKNDN